MRADMINYVYIITYIDLVFIHIIRGDKIHDEITGEYLKKSRVKIKLPLGEEYLEIRRVVADSR